jgi:hypothetical protein
MFATIEEKLIVAALAALVVVVGVLGYNHHERKLGATICVQQQSKAASTEVQKDKSDAKKAVVDFNADISAIPIAASHTPAMLMCDAPSSVRKVAAPAGAKPIAQPNIKTDSGLQTGIEPRVDIGSVVQDLALSGLLCTADAEQLWQLAIKESQK